MKLGLGVQKKMTSGGGGLYLDLSPLTQLPAGRQSAVQAAASSAAAGQSYSAQDVVAALATLNYASFLTEDGCCFSDTSGTVLRTTDGAVLSFKGWSSTAILGVRNVAKSDPTVSSQGLDVSVGFIDLNGVLGNANGTIMVPLRSVFGTAVSSVRPFGFGISASNLPGTNVDGVGLNVLRLGIQGANNFNYTAGSSSAGHVLRHSTQYVAPTNRNVIGYNGNAIVKAELPKVSAGQTATFDTTAHLGSNLASPNGFIGRLKGYAFVANTTSNADFEKVARFCQFYYFQPVMRSLIDRTVISVGTSITYGAGGTGDTRWVDEVATATQCLMFAHGIGSNRITAPLTATPWDNVMSATLAEAAQAGESYETVLIPVLNTQASAPIVLLDHNTNDNNQPVGTVSLANVDRTTYVGALNYVANQVLLTRSDAIIIGLTGWPDARSLGAGTIPSQLAINQGMRDWCTLRGFQCIDVATLLDDVYGINPYNIGASPLLADTVHPTGNGHRAIASVVIPELMRIFP